MRITHDANKRAVTITQRGLDFADAGIVFAGGTSPAATNGHSTMRSG